MISNILLVDAHNLFSDMIVPILCTLRPSVRVFVWRQNLSSSVATLMILCFSLARPVLSPSVRFNNLG